MINSALVRVFDIRLKLLFKSEIKNSITVMMGGGGGGRENSIVDCAIHAKAKQSFVKSLIFIPEGFFGIDYYYY